MNKLFINDNPLPPSDQTVARATCITYSLRHTSDLWGDIITGDIMNYSALLQDVRWKAKRHEILIRDDWNCHKCGNKTRRKAVHHTKYIYGLMPWEYEDKYLVTICMGCHLTHHTLEAIGMAFGFTEEDKASLDDLFFSASPFVDVGKLFRDMKIMLDKYEGYSA